MSGYWATGSFVIPSTPSRTMITEMTVLRTGCVIKLFSIFLRLFGVAVEAVCIYRPGDHHRAVPQVEAVDQYPVATFEAIRYYKEFAVIGGCRGDRHRDDLVVADKQVYKCFVLQLIGGRLRYHQRCVHGTGNAYDRAGPAADEAG